MNEHDFVYMSVLLQWLPDFEGESSLDDAVDQTLAFGTGKWSFRKMLEWA